MNNVILIGYPIKNSLSPIMHNTIFEFLGIKFKYSIVSCSEDRLLYFLKKIRNRKIHGANITFPYKRKVINNLDYIDEASRKIQSVNTVVFNKKLLGYNTDYYGFLKLLFQFNVSVKYKKVLLLGSGGVAKTVIYCLLKSGCNYIVLANRTKKKAEEIKNRMLFFFPGIKIFCENLNISQKVVNNSHIIINTTSIGMNNFFCPIQSNIKFYTSQVVIDIVYQQNTSLLRKARINGAKAINGRIMFLYQGYQSLKYWSGKKVKVNLKIMKESINIV